MDFDDLFKDSVGVDSAKFNQKSKQPNDFDSKKVYQDQRNNTNSKPLDLSDMYNGQRQDGKNTQNIKEPKVGQQQFNDVDIDFLSQLGNKKKPAPAKNERDLDIDHDPFLGLQDLAPQEQFQTPKPQKSQEQKLNANNQFSNEFKFNASPNLSFGDDAFSSNKNIFADNPAKQKSTHDVAPQSDTSAYPNIESKYKKESLYGEAPKAKPSADKDFVQQQQKQQQEKERIVQEQKLKLEKEQRYKQMQDEKEDQRLKQEKLQQQQEILRKKKQLEEEERLKREAQEQQRVKRENGPEATQNFFTFGNDGDIPVDAQMGQKSQKQNLEKSNLQSSAQQQQGGTSSGQGTKDGGAFFEAHFDDMNQSKSQNLDGNNNQQSQHRMNSGLDQTPPTYEEFANAQRNHPDDKVRSQFKGLNLNSAQDFQQQAFRFFGGVGQQVKNLSKQAEKYIGQKEQQQTPNVNQRATTGGVDNKNKGGLLDDEDDDVIHPAQVRNNIQKASYNTNKEQSNVQNEPSKQQPNHKRSSDYLDQVVLNLSRMPSHERLNMLQHMDKQDRDYVEQELTDTLLKKQQQPASQQPQLRKQSNTSSQQNMYQQQQQYQKSANDDFQRRKSEGAKNQVPKNNKTPEGPQSHTYKPSTNTFSSKPTNIQATEDFLGLNDLLSEDISYSFNSFDNQAPARSQPQPQPQQPPQQPKPSQQQPQQPFKPQQQAQPQPSSTTGAPKKKSFGYGNDLFEDLAFSSGPQQPPRNAQPQSNAQPSASKSQPPPRQPSASSSGIGGGAQAQQQAFNFAQAQNNFFTKEAGLGNGAQTPQQGTSSQQKSSSFHDFDAFFGTSAGQTRPPLAQQPPFTSQPPFPQQPPFTQQYGYQQRPQQQFQQQQQYGQQQTFGQQQQRPFMQQGNQRPAGGMPSMTNLMLEMQKFINDDNLNDVDMSQYNYLYQEKESLRNMIKENQDPNENPTLKRLREQKMVAKYKRLQEILREQKSKPREQKKVHEKQEESKQQMGVISDQIRSEVDAWGKPSRGNITRLLLTLDRVLSNFMPNSKWQKPKLEDLLDAGKVKKMYHKANMIVHPDKVQQRGGSPRELAAANMIFEILKDGWEKYQQ